MKFLLAMFLAATCNMSLTYEVQYDNIEPVIVSTCGHDIIFCQEFALDRMCQECIWSD